ncbi:MAG: phage baseplate assembly protein V [Desulfobacterales bacterium]|nr:phage baseplate assembly protein V [Desulfobacterales bacterium]
MLSPAAAGRPVARAQVAHVVGLEDQVVTTDRDHRIKIQFPWQRGSAPLAGGLNETGPSGRNAGKTGNAPGNDQSGTWVRVAEWLSGANWGSHFLPRIGSEVVVDFLDGDIDRPIVVGQAYNGADLPPSRPATKPGPITPGCSLAG